MKSGVDRADRDLQDLGHPVEWDIGVVVEDQHGRGDPPTGGGSPSRAGRGAGPHRAHRTLRARQPAGSACSATRCGPDAPPRSKRERGVGTTRRQSAPDRAVAEGLARSQPARADLRPRPDRCRARSCATRGGTSMRGRRRVARRPPGRRAGPGSRARYPRPSSATVAPVHSSALTRYVLPTPGAPSRPLSLGSGEVPPGRRRGGRVGRSRRGPGGQPDRRASRCRGSRASRHAHRASRRAGCRSPRRGRSTARSSGGYTQLTGARAPSSRRMTRPTDTVAGSAPRA